LVGTVAEVVAAADVMVDVSRVVLVELDAAVVDDTCDDEADVNVGASVEVGVSVVVGAAGDVDTEVVSASPAVTVAQTADAAFATVGAYPGGQSLIAQSRIPNPQFGARHRQFISFAAQLNVPAMFINLV
jgi:hypothetical protein